jgi:hypothetical protein
MALVTEKTGLHGDRFTGKFGRPAGFGAYVFGDNRFGEYSEIQGVYQYQMGAKKKVCSLHRDNFPSNPQTEAQQAWRAVFTAGKEAWDALDTENKEAYNNLRYPPGQSGFNRFMSKYLKAHR